MTLRRSAFGFIAPILLLLAIPLALSAQKRPLDHDSYDEWKSIRSTTLSADGNWITYVITAREADGTLTLRSVRSGPAMVGAVERGSSPAITPDSRFLVFTIDPMQSVVDSLEEAEADRDEMPDDSLGVIPLAEAFSGNVLTSDFFRAGSVRSWRIPEEEGAYVAYLLEKEEASEEAAEAEEPEAEEPAGEEEEEEGSDRDKEEGHPLVLRDLDSGNEYRFENVTDYTFTEDGTWLVYAASNDDGTADGVYAVRTSSGEAASVLTGEGEYTEIALDEDGTQVAFLTNRDDWEADEPAFTLYHAVLGQDARAVATTGTQGVPEGWLVSEHGNVSFSDEGSRILFGTAPPPFESELEDVPEDDRVEVDIWNWKDPLIQPMQKVRAEREAERTYLAYASTDDLEVVQLGRLDISEVRISQGGDGDLALAGTNTMVKYGWYVSHEDSFYDVYLLDAATGEAELILEKTRWQPDFSPDADHLSWWDGEARAWMIMDVATREMHNATATLPFPVHDELDDHPQPPYPYGSPGWLEDDEALLIYDRFDIWALDPAGREAPRNLTEGVGRANDIEFRYISLDDDGYSRFGGGSDEGIDPEEEALLSAFHLYTKQDGFYRDQFSGTREPRRLLMDDYRFGRPDKAEDADVVVLTRQSFEEFPDLWLTDTDFTDMEKITEANPQQDEYLWGTAELVEWVSNDGTPLQGILAKPENFDPTRKYPMMVYFYERNSDNLHRYRSPSPGTSVNQSFYVSRGYVFFVPDIPYEIGHPGESAIDAVVPGVLKVVDEGYIDKDRIGAQGHSWGGYQLAYMITRTNLFAAVEGGAPVSNMTSAYGGIRWASGMNRAFQYERTQSRIGGSLWEETLRYINNSPLFEADKVQTPFLMIHNDEDGAVPWYQGIEFFMALRRLQKPVWMFNYNGEPHGLRQRPNQEDWTIRMQQFFDHYLTGAPAPVWMVEGVPAVLKGKTLGLELVGEGGRQ